MRLLENFDAEQDAQEAVEVLFVHGITATMKQGRDDSFSLWVHEEDEMDAARDLLVQIRENPQMRPEIASRAKAMRSEAKKSAKSARHREARAREALAPKTGIGPVTMALIAACVIVAVLTKLGDDTAALRPFTFVGFEIIGETRALPRGWASYLVDQQWWRLLTPIFIHFGIMHIGFNGWWLKDLGSAIEREHSSKVLIAMVLIMGVTSNVAQYVIEGGFLFGGMSGVVFGLFGFIWIRGRFDPTSRLGMPKQTVMWMMAWFAICFTGIVGPIANTAHAVGLVVGGAWGFLTSGYLRRKFMR